MPWYAGFTRIVYGPSCSGLPSMKAIAFGSAAMYEVSWDMTAEVLAGGQQGGGRLRPVGGVQTGVEPDEVRIEVERERVVGEARMTRCHGRRARVGLGQQLGEQEGVELDRHLLATVVRLVDVEGDGPARSRPSARTRCPCQARPGRRPRPPPRRRPGSDRCRVSAHLGEGCVVRHDVVLPVEPLLVQAVRRRPLQRSLAEQLGAVEGNRLAGLGDGAHAGRRCEGQRDRHPAVPVRRRRPEARRDRVLRRLSRVDLAGRKVTGLVARARRGPGCRS